MAEQKATWSWKGLRQGDPYGTGAPGKPIPTIPGQQTTGGMWPPAGFKGPEGGWPSNLRDIWEGVYKFQGYPKPLAPEQQQYFQQYLQPWEQFTPPRGTPLSPEFQQQVPGIGKTSFVFGFNAGPQMASVPMEQGPSSPWGGWQPAQAEASPEWDEGYA